jgi:hypothetical protein
MADDKMAVLKDQWQSAKSAVQRAEAAFQSADGAYQGAVKTADRKKMEEAAANRRAAADKLKAAQLKEAELNYLLGNDADNRDSLRYQAGKDFTQGKVFQKVPDFGF